MTNTTSTYALTKSVMQFPEYRAERQQPEPVSKPRYPIEHRSRRHD